MDRNLLFILVKAVKHTMKKEHPECYLKKFPYIFAGKKI